MASSSGLRSGPSGIHATGFTLLEVLIALSILGLMTAVAVPSLARRLESAFAAADLAQVVSSAQLLPVRLATMGVELRLNEKAQAQPLPDGRPPLDLPPNWSLKSKEAPVFGRAGACRKGSLIVQEDLTARRWRISFADITCAVSITVLTGETA